MKIFYHILFFLCFSVNSQNKIDGISFVASNREITPEAIEPVIAVNANWVTLMPFAFMKTVSDTAIVYNSKRQWLGERKEGIQKTASAFHKKGLKIMLKPQIWIPRGGFTGNIKMNTEADWILLEKNYEKFILEYANLAQTTHCEIFCIGTELSNFVKTRPQFWNILLVKVKKMYTGKITYAENWDSYKLVPFINQLDFIGIDAYFPLVPDQNPTIKALAKSWKPIKKEIKKLSSLYKKPILFTEFGYQSKDFSAHKPWEFSEKASVNLDIQVKALAVIFASFWKEKWFAGGFLWKWYDNHNQVGGKLDTDYTVQNKPAELIVKKFYAN